MRTGLQKYIHEKQLYVINLRIRLLLIRTDFAYKNDFEKNEINILEHETKQIIANTNNIINIKTNELCNKVTT